MVPDDSFDEVRDERALLQLVDDALQLPPAEREAFLQERCGSVAARLVRVRALLAACLRAGEEDGFLAVDAAAFAEPLVRSVERRRAREPDDAVPRVVGALAGRYEFGREIGRGGNAIVYLANDLRHRREVAIKVVQATVADTAQRMRFFREVEVVARLRHPYVVPLIDSGEADGVLFYVMPYIEGQSLRQRLDIEGALALDVALSLARDVGEALDAAHAMGIVHRDIKPQNILLSGEHALVADFGIALALHDAADERLTALGMVIGTPAYMSPEQATAS